MADKSLIADLDSLAVVLARQKPAYEQDTAGLPGMTLGYYEASSCAESIPKAVASDNTFRMKLPPRWSSISTFDFLKKIPNSRLATLRLAKFSFRSMFAVPLPLFLAAINPRSAIRRCLVDPCFP